MKHDSPYMISRRKRMLGLSDKPESKKRVPIAKRSARMKTEFKKYLPAMKEFLNRPENKNCAIKMKGCTGKATVVHHAAGRIGNKLHDQIDWVASCTNCNLRVEISDLEARDKGFKKSRHKV